MFLKAVKIISLSFLTTLLIGCGASRQVVQTKLVRERVPDELLSCKELKKPVARSERDIIIAYVEAFRAYKECILKLEAIKRPQEAR